MATQRFAHLFRAGGKFAVRPMQTSTDALGERKPERSRYYKDRKNPDIQGAERHGRRTERERWCAVFAHPSSTRNVQLATILLSDTNWPAGDIIGKLNNFAKQPQLQIHSIEESWAATFAKMRRERVDRDPVQASWSKAFERVGALEHKERSE